MFRHGFMEAFCLLLLKVHLHDLFPFVADGFCKGTRLATFVVLESSLSLETLLIAKAKNLSFLVTSEDEASQFIDTAPVGILV